MRKGPRDRRVTSQPCTRCKRIVAVSCHTDLRYISAVSCMCVGARDFTGGELPFACPFRLTCSVYTTLFFLARALHAHVTGLNTRVMVHAERLGWT